MGKPTTKTKHASVMYCAKQGANCLLKAANGKKHVSTLTFLSEIVYTLSSGMV